MHIFSEHTHTIIGNMQCVYFTTFYTVAVLELHGFALEYYCKGNYSYLRLKHQKLLQSRHNYVKNVIIYKMQQHLEVIHPSPVTIFELYLNAFFEIKGHTKIWGRCRVFELCCFLRYFKFSLSWSYEKQSVHKTNKLVCVSFTVHCLSGCFMNF